ncbi:elongator complex protein 4 isoform X3 [Acipenser ruthenus]|uniref:elongator complex protein 4 isoform X3 n=1 Tax=Acipenser ruthenus TaxID=7906 RepID=UPI0027403957|nr:elongator complex protein 4 isoform X3 [Acipenser ruthenus]
MATNAGVNVNAGTRANATSFQKKSRSKLASIPGTRPSVQNGQLLVSTGVTSLDYVIGGGLAVGTLLLIEEDKYDSYSRMLLKYFLAEGVVCGHSLYIASSRDHPGDILQELPAPLLDEISNTEVEKELAKAGDSSRETQDSMKIAWRYQNLPKVQTTLASSSRFGHYYDVSKSMSTDMCEAATCHSFFLPNELPLESAAESSNMNMGYIKLLRSIQGVIHKEGFDGAGPQNKAIMGRITKLCDTVVSLESFSGSERETNPLYKDYHGLLHVKQIPHLNSLMCEVPDTKDLAFKLKRKQFTIERLHLPPDLSDTVSRLSKQDLAESAKLLGLGCGTTATGKNHLDF